jgi:peptidoglycan/xylan/chitin deacetylase (PgdA/CDA1 family)
MQPIKFSLAEKTGALALLSGLLLSFFWPIAAAIPLFCFLLCCLVAPFVSSVGFFLPVISRGNPQNNRVSLTFDDGPSPVSTPVLLELLARYGLTATFFVLGRQAAKYPELIAAILAHGHSIGNHSLRHDPFLMLRSSRTLREDIHATQEILRKQGVIPAVFRPPVGITGPRLKQVLAEENLAAVTYSCRALDLGNRNIDDLSGKILRRLQPGDIIMLHDLPPWRADPGAEENIDSLQREFDRLFKVLQDKYQVVSLEEHIRQPVMTSVPAA